MDRELNTAKAKEVFEARFPLSTEFMKTHGPYYKMSIWFLGNQSVCNLVIWKVREGTEFMGDKIFEASDSSLIGALAKLEYFLSDNGMNGK
jgi:hypothetical protein